LVTSSIQIVTVRGLLSVMACSAFACSPSAHINPISAALPATLSVPWSGNRNPRALNSFMGVHFGDSIEDVERRFPSGSPQTSPYGAPAYLAENVTSGTISYQDVIYEFAEPGGMQMVIAHFAPPSAADVYKQLQDTLGAPSSAGANVPDASSVEASWQMPDGGSVLFSGRAHRLVLIGKDGSSLKTDIRLRDLDVPVEG
jgi:hypothetical protein